VERAEGVAGTSVAPDALQHEVLLRRAGAQQARWPRFCGAPFAKTLTLHRARGNGGNFLAGAPAWQRRCSAPFAHPTTLLQNSGAWHDAGMKITDARVMQTAAIATVVLCAGAIGYVGALAHHSAQDWIVLGSMAVILVCTLFTMLHEIWKRNA
jgi:hypothetical protein